MDMEPFLPTYMSPQSPRLGNFVSSLTLFLSC
jgi:hypothetical protein